MAMTASAAITIDGSQGEGGGQILRTALSLAMVTGRPVAVERIRAGRSKPGLLRQHLAAVRAATQISAARVTGDQLGSMSIEFVPGAIRGGRYHFAIGTAGSTTLLWQTLLPALLSADCGSEVTLEGGTHNSMAPSVDFVEHVYLPQLANMGIAASLELTRHGFYPQGGGHWRVSVEPWWQRRPLHLTERGALLSCTGVAKLASVPRHVAERELQQVHARLGWPKTALSVESVDSPGPGNILSLTLAFANVTQVFEALGERRVSAERVAGRAIEQVRTYLASDYPVTEHLADQLLLLMVIGTGGSFRTSALTAHTRTNIAVIEQFFGYRCIQVDEQGTGALIRVDSCR